MQILTQSMIFSEQLHLKAFVQNVSLWILSAWTIFGFSSLKYLIVNVQVKTKTRDIL